MAGMTQFPMSGMVTFDMDGLEVTVRPRLGFEQAAQAKALADELFRSRQTASQLAADLAEAKLGRPKAGPARLLGRGYVRFFGAEMWILNRRERGAGEFGYQVADWDDLFRRFNARVVDHGVDEHGEWWAVESFDGDRERARNTGGGT
jgi:hypothetical protein